MLQAEITKATTTLYCFYSTASTSKHCLKITQKVSFHKNWCARAKRVLIFYFVTARVRSERETNTISQWHKNYQKWTCPLRWQRWYFFGSFQTVSRPQSSALTTTKYVFVLSSFLSEKLILAWEAAISSYSGWLLCQGLSYYSQLRQGQQRPRKWMPDGRRLQAHITTKDCSLCDTRKKLG